MKQIASCVDEIAPEVRLALGASFISKLANMSFDQFHQSLGDKFALGGVGYIDIQSAYQHYFLAACDEDSQLHPLASTLEEAIHGSIDLFDIRALCQDSYGLDLLRNGCLKTILFENITHSLRIAQKAQDFVAYEINHLKHSYDIAALRKNIANLHVSTPDIDLNIEEYSIVWNISHFLDTLYTSYALSTKCTSGEFAHFRFSLVAYVAQRNNIAHKFDLPIFEKAKWRMVVKKRRVVSHRGYNLDNNDEPLGILWD